MSRIRTLALGAALAIVALGAGMLVSRTLISPGAPTLASGTLLTPARPLRPIAFIDHEGRPFDAARLKGRWSLLFFGFTSCPDVCPTTLAVLAQVEKKLTDLPPAQRPQVILASVDPQRDTPERLAKYVKFFSPTFIGVTAEPAALEEFARTMGVPVIKTPTGEGGYTVDHSASVFAVNPSAELRALFSAPHSAEALAKDLRRLMRARQDG
ncbi:MAG TPA: SCO family protein [Steroidobacter sp.]|nr:SCO family protein [Steroidobacter sp.]